MKNIWPELALRAAVIAMSAVAPMSFPAAEAGYSTLHDLSMWAIIPAAVVIGLSWLLLGRSSNSDIAHAIGSGALAGAAATVALEAVRYTGFRLGLMPGNLPELMGVLLLNRFALGPSTASAVAGFTYHFWNGACFGIIFAIGRLRFADWWAIPYALLLGLGFLVSPVVQALGVGLFGRDFGGPFVATVLTAHFAFGSAMAWLLSRLGREDLHAWTPRRIRTPISS